MSDYLHGAYGDSQANGNRVSADGQSAIVCIGTAPVQTVEGGAANVNTPKIVRNIAEARKLFGYSDNWADYTLCEAIHHFFENEAIGPLVLINVLDPATHRAGAKTTASKTPVNNRITIADAENAILDSVVLKTAPSEGDPVVKVKDTDYTITYNAAKKSIIITGLTNLGSDAMTVEYNTVTPANVTAADVIGATDGNGSNTGLYAVKNVYQLAGVIPAYLIAPGFSSVPAVHNAMASVSRKVNGHWDMWMFTDLPIADGATPLTMDTVLTLKSANGYNRENETVYFPMAEGTDGRKYHLSVIAAANFLKLMAENDGIPFHSASNTEAAIIRKLWLGASAENQLYDDTDINEKLNKNGIASAAFVGGRWAIWGAHAADYNQDDADMINVSETARMMLYYLSNDFQARRPASVDRPLTRNGIASIVAEEQTRLDALKAMGALTYGRVTLNAESLANSDVYNGDFLFDFEVTTTPLAKSLKAMVTWVDEGFSTYFAAGTVG